MKPLLKREYERSKKLARELEATGDLSSGPAGAFEREPTVLNPVTTSKP
jgi:hypothetical protein